MININVLWPLLGTQLSQGLNADVIDLWPTRLPVRSRGQRSIGVVTEVYYINTFIIGGTPSRQWWSVSVGVSSQNATSFGSGRLITTLGIGIVRIHFPLNHHKNRSVRVRLKGQSTPNYRRAAIMAAPESRFEGGKEKTEMLWRHIGNL